MHWVTRICKGPARINYKRLYGAATRVETRRLFHRKTPESNVTATQTRTEPDLSGGGGGDLNNLNAKLKECNDGDLFVVSGISGRFAQSDSMKELKDNLNNGVDMVTEHTRFDKVSPKAPTRMGVMKNEDKFDAEFFNITPHMAECMDLNMRKVLEVTFEAMFDAGLNPTKLRGTKTGVYIGTVGGESTEYWTCKGAVDELEGYKVVGIPNFFQPGRLSYHLDLRGPSMAINTGCSAGLIGLELAMLAIEKGTCDQAIVAGTQIHMSQYSTLELTNLSAVSVDGRCKVFDDAANGFARAEAIVAIMVQRKRDAKRHYCTIRGIRSNSDGFKREGLTFPSSAGQEVLLKETYKETGIDPADIEYFEAHGTGTAAGDPQELIAIANVVGHAPNRKEPLLLGSVKSNLGHTESTAGLTSLAKVCIAIEQGIIPANLHFKTINQYAKHLFDGRMKIVDEHMPYKGGLIGLSSYGLAGSNIHVILEPGPRANPRNNEAQKLTEENAVPILIPFSGRTKELVEQSLKEACEIGKNAEARGLLHEAFQHNIPNHGYRGYGLFLPGQAEEPTITVEKLNASESKPLWFIFPGMGSQWNEMGKDLMKLDAYAESIKKSQIILRNVGVDLEHLLRPNNPTIFDNIRDSLVAITAVQVALYDTLISMGLKPDGFLGHSSGEILCAYADGCMSGEEALLVGNARGRAFHESVSEPGGMASVGLTWEEATRRCPPGIYPACHNAAENVSVSGPLEDIKKFVSQLQSEGVFARLVNSCLCAPHSKYVYPATELLFKYMSEIFQDDRPRTERWISSSIPESRWNTPLAQTSSSAYHVNNMQNPVLFHEAVLKVPNNAVVIEIAPRGLFQPLLKGSLHRDCTLIAPMHHEVEDKLSFFLSSVGRMYNAGMNLNVGTLYPHIHFPVSSTAPSTSSLIKWDHERSWRVHCLKNYKEDMAIYSRVNLGDRRQQYLEGHKLDTRCVYPATGYLIQVWKGFATSQGRYFSEMPVIFENINFERATFIKEDKHVYLRYQYHSATNNFTCEEDGMPVVIGRVRSVENIKDRMFDLEPVPIPETSKRRSLDADGIYKEFRLRGYNYTGEFRGIRKIDNEGKWAQIAWRGNYISFVDTLLQTIVLSVMTRCTAIPVRIKSVIIDPVTFLEYVKTHEEVVPGEDVNEAAQHGDKEMRSTGYGDTDQIRKHEVLIPVSIYAKLGVIKCPGMELRGLTAMVIPRARQKETLSVEDYIFTPFFDDKHSNLRSAYNSNVAELFDLVLENIKTTKLKIFDVFGNSENSQTNFVIDLVSLKPKHRAELVMLSTAAEVEKLDEKIRKLPTTITTKDSVEALAPETMMSADLVFLDEISLLPSFAEKLHDNSHIILRSVGADAVESAPETLQKVSQKLSDGATLTLFKKLPADKTPVHVLSSVCVDNNNFDWLPDLQAAMTLASNDGTQPNARVYLYSQNNPESGILGMTKCLRLEKGGDKLRCIYDPEGKLNLTDFKNPSNELQQILEQDLVTNVVRSGQLGTYRHIPMSQDAGAPSKEVIHAYVNTLTTGDLTSLRWVESPLSRHDPVKDEDKGQLVHINYAALNFRDIMLATGKLPVDSRHAYNPQDCVFGFEFSGTDPEGQRVMGCMSSKAMASSALIGKDSLIWPVPEGWSLADAATVPVVYATVYYSLFQRAGILPGQSILIHAGTGGVGQAAIHVALDLNCEIFTTVGTEEKKRFLLDLFPTLKPENIGNSRNCTFEKLVMERTNGKGVDIVLNSLADDKLQASTRCLAIHGTFLEIGSFDSFKNSNLGMDMFLGDIGFEGIKLNHFLTKPQSEKEALGKLFKDGIDRGVVKPLARHIFEKEQVEEAFRFMASGKHMGKVLIEVQKEENLGEKPLLKAVPRSYFSPEKSYVIIGGLGGMGLELANWLVDRGARHLILTSRSGVKTGYQELCLRKWEERDVKVETPVIDLSNFEVAEQFIKEQTAEGKQIGGIFNSGLVLKDAPIEEQTIEDFQAVAAPKTDVTRNLDKLTREHCKEGLDYFVIFSSMACGRGNSSQSNYGLANSVMEQICDNRKKDGLHGLAIQWGIIGEVGAVAEGIFGAKLTGEEVFDGTLAQRINSCLDVLDMTLHQDCSTVSSMVLAEDDGMRSKRAGLVETIAHICGVKDLSNIHPTTKLIDLGMDSLIGMEIKQLIERDYDTPLTANELRVMTFNDILMIEAGTYVAGQSLRQAQEDDSKRGVDLEELLKGGQEICIQFQSDSPGDEDTPKLFIVHGIEGYANVFNNLAEKLTIDVYGFQYPMMGDEEERAQLQTIDSLARRYITELKKIQPEGPYQLAGYSAGGSVAVEMALLLENEFKDQVDNLIILDGCAVWQKMDHKNDGELIVNGLMGVLSNTIDLAPAEKTKVFENTVKDDPDQFVRTMTDLIKTKNSKVDPELVTKYFTSTRKFFDMCRNYDSDKKVNGNVMLIKAQDKTHILTGITDEKHYLQDNCVDEVVTHTVTGDHTSFLHEENVAETASIINDIFLS